MKLWTLILASALAFTSLHADASKRLGGGKSVGQQSNNVTQNQAAKPAAPKGDALVLPKANVDDPTSKKRKRNFVEQIFGGDEDPTQSDQPKKKKKKKKKKTLFDSIF